MIADYLQKTKKNKKNKKMERWAGGRKKKPRGEVERGVVA